ncbi:hypothetical protein BKA67DRAFT_529526 [Truncatella angustata]|uniref:Carrier domain-containing protein n=1 Tax=Truncatella angustata TaxID=152316 RepID=A0A9P9A2G4_9PEZI|nr:uncharacterized protein BKA67DRAFT_529526 [Truncatella angustata]KAH6659372.1 hypothetical protein BKA67DRAFT_529526 [Truncatella angustata]
MYYSSNMKSDCVTDNLSEATGGVCPIEPPVWQRLRNSTQERPESLAIASIYQPANLYGIASGQSGNGYLRWSYLDLELATERFAHKLSQLGAQNGAPLATFLDNGVEFVVACWAAHRLGCPFVPLNPRALNNYDEATHMLNMACASVVILQDTKQCHVIEAMQKGGSVYHAKVFVSGIPTNASWISFSAMLEKPTEDCALPLSESLDASEELVAVLFTSGTTSKPKGVPHTNSTINAFCQNLSLGKSSPTSVFCSVLPNNHAMGYFFALHFMMHGGAIVYPSPIFDAMALVNALETEKVTHTAVVPTCLHALIEAIDARGSILSSSLEDVCLAGSSLTPENIKQIFTKLGSRGASAGFGMTEGSPIWSCSKHDPEDLILDNSVIVGSASRGARVRVCAPNSRELLPRGQPGEIHQTGPGTIKSYLGLNVGTDQFYDDEEGYVWFVTGDQGIMHRDGRFTITGRYKDMIIRGGENISPAVIEAVVSRCCKLQGYVVGAPDPIAGEVPVLILEGKHLEAARHVQDVVLRELGAAYVPERTITLTELGFADFPRTTSNKIQKSQLIARVRALLSDEVMTSSSTDEVAIKDKVLAAYFKSTGVPIEKLDVNIPTVQFADSIAFMRVRDYLRKSLSHTLTTKEMNDHPTIAAQIKLLRDRSASNTRSNKLAGNSLRQSSMEDLSILFGGMKEARAMMLRISDVLQAKQLSWPQVLSVVPAHDYLQVLLNSQIIETWNFAIAVVTKGFKDTNLVTALKKALSNHPILTSFIAVDHAGSAHYVTLLPDENLWDQCIFRHGSVKNSKDVQNIAVDFPRPHLSRVPGPLISCLLFHIEESDSAAVVFYLHHIVQDATSFRLFLDDLDQALSAPMKDLVPHTDFKVWADLYSALRLSPAATASVNFHVNRLRDLHNHKKAIYPPAKVARRANTDSPDGLDYGFDAPGLTELRREHPSIAAAVVLKAAMALINVHRTDHSHAAFCNFEAGRRQFPFLPTAVQAMNPGSFEASDVNGPVMQGVCNLIEVPRNETAISLLSRLQTEQEGLTEHAHAPLQRVIDNLNAEGHGSGDAIVDIHRTQFTTRQDCNSLRGRFGRSCWFGRSGGNDVHALLAMGRGKLLS